MNTFVDGEKLGDFLSWRHEVLAQFAAEVWERTQLLEKANEQLRQDLRDAMILARKG